VVDMVADGLISPPDHNIGSATACFSEVRP
jgi:hypothetical protein